MAATRLAHVVQRICDLATVCPSAEGTDPELLRRFVTERDRLAFEVLVRRHGPLVLSVCRRVLRQEQDAEDAFQATFLVLARKAASIRQPGGLVSWLHGVAYRLAMDSKRRAARRREIEKCAKVHMPKDPSWENAWHEVEATLHEEVARLPDRLRAPFLLCCIEGHDRAEAARQLGVVEGTVWSRLNQARKVLQGRLARRGISLSAVFSAAAVAGSPGRAALPPALATATARAALGVAAGIDAGEASPAVLAMAERAVRGMTLAKIKLGLLLALTVILVTGVAVLARTRGHEAGAPNANGLVPALPSDDEAKRTDQLGDALPAGALMRMGTVRMRHKEGVHSVTFTADGRGLITAGGDGWVRWWNPNDGREILKVGGAEFYPVAVALSRDGQILAAAGGKGVTLWDAKTGKTNRHLECEIDGHNPVPLTFAPDGAIVATAGKDRAIHVFEVSTGKELLRLPLKAERIHCLAFTTNGKQLVAAEQGSGTGVRVWDIASGQLVREAEIKSPGNERVRPLALAADGKMLALECAGQVQVKKAGGIEVSTAYRLCLWDVETNTERLRTDGERNVLWAAAFSVDGKRIAVNGMGNEVVVWDTADGKLRARLKADPESSRPDGTTTLAFSPDGKWIASVGDSAAVHLWDIESGRELGVQSEAHQAAVSAVAYSPDGRVLASAASDHTVRLWDPRSGRQLRVLREHSAGVRALVFSPDGRVLASACQESSIALWDVASGKVLKLIQAVPRTEGVYSGVCPLAFAPDGKSLLSWGDDRQLRSWDVATGKERWSRSAPLRDSAQPPSKGRPDRMPAYEETIQCVRYSPDASKVAVGMPKAVYVLNTADGKELLKLDRPGNPECLAFAPDGRTLAIAGWDKALRLWEVATGQQIFKVEGLGTVNALAFAPDGRTIATSENWRDGVIRILDARAGQTLGRFQGHDCYASALAYARDGKTIASGQRDTTVIIWDLAPVLKSVPTPAAKSAAEIEGLWEDLASVDVQNARNAIWALASSPQAAVALFQQRVRPVARARPERISQLIADLDAGDFAAREQATRALAALNVEVEAALREALKGNPSAEARRRIEALLEGEAVPVAPAGDVLRLVRAIETLERIGSPEALQLLRTLAEGAPSARETCEARAACQHLMVMQAGP